MMVRPPFVQKVFFHHHAIDEMADRCMAIMHDLGVFASYGVSTTNPLEWGNNFLSSPPELADLVRVAETHGYDVVEWSFEVFDEHEWGAIFRKVEARDPAFLDAEMARAEADAERGVVHGF